MKIDLSHVDDRASLTVDMTSTITEESIAATDPVHIIATAFKIGNDVVVNGRIEVTLTFECSRCLKKFYQMLTLPIDIHGMVDVHAEKQEIDLTEDIRESIILAIPTNPLCCTDCPGLCPQCGHNLSEGACSCQTTLCDNRMEQLKKYKFK